MRVSSLGRWVPIHREKWGRDLLRPLTDVKQILEKYTISGDMVFKKGILAWRAGEYKVLSLLLAIRRVMVSKGRGKFDITKYNAVAADADLQCVQHPPQRSRSH
jgi:hypothetical protein